DEEHAAPADDGKQQEEHDRCDQIARGITRLQDIYQTFLETQRNYSSYTVGAIAIVYNIGAICGGLFFGALSQRIGRRRA
ncbi:MFS transporter, partial [Rhizobium ruizarguesonis]